MEFWISNKKLTTQLQTLGIKIRKKTCKFNLAGQNVYKPTRYTKFLWLDFVFQYTLYMFRTVSVHLQEQSSYKLYVVFGICRYHTSGCFVAIATQQPDVSAYTGIHQIRHTAYKKIAPEDGLIESEHVERILKNKV